MVVKRRKVAKSRMLKFESSVISYGSKTVTSLAKKSLVFESSVISYGSKTATFFNVVLNSFESSVISYGSKTNLLCKCF